jgi:sugar/nucleoside kinase (ribokinase family)
MAVDILILNTAVVDFRDPHFDFVDNLAGPGGLAKCPVTDMPDYSQEQYYQWIKAGKATAGGPGNTAPLIAKAGTTVAVGAYLGKGQYDGLDAQGRFFYDTMQKLGVDMSPSLPHPTLPTGTTFIHDRGVAERGGIVYFPNANDDFDFGTFAPAVEKLNPKIVYYMYSGLSERGDANGGRDLADFMKWCRSQDAITLADSHTLVGGPDKIIKSGGCVEEYELLAPLLPELDVFFTSSDEAKMIENTLAEPKNWKEIDEPEFASHFLGFISHRFLDDINRPCIFGLTVKDGAYYVNAGADGTISNPKKVKSNFVVGDIVDLVGAGDSFRAGFLTYLANHIDAFHNGTLNVEDAIQVGNLFAALYIKAPIGNRYGYIDKYSRLEKAVKSGKSYRTFEEILDTIKQK